MAQLTLKQENFCLAYMETGNASEAYRRAFNTSRMKPETISRKAKEVLDNGKITARLAELRKPVIEKAQLTLDRVLQECMNIGFFDISTIYDDDGTLKPIREWPAAARQAVSSIETMEVYAGAGKNREFVGYAKRVKLADKNQALEKLMKHLGAFEKDNKQKANPLLALIQAVQGSAFPLAHANMIDVVDSDDD